MLTTSSPASSRSDPEQQQKSYTLQNQPPEIIVSTTPAVLALTDGPPALQAASDGLQKVINTRSLIVFQASRPMFCLALMEGWVCPTQRQHNPWWGML